MSEFDPSLDLFEGTPDMNKRMNQSVYITCRDTERLTNTIKYIQFVAFDPGTRGNSLILLTERTGPYNFDENGGC
jgi:hypothetical protein